MRLTSVTIHTTWKAAKVALWMNWWRPYGATTSTAGKMEHVNATMTPKAQYSMMVVNGSSQIGRNSNNNSNPQLKAPQESLSLKSTFWGEIYWIGRSRPALHKAAPSVHAKSPDPTVIWSSWRCRPCHSNDTTYRTRKQYRSTLGCHTTLAYASFQLSPQNLWPFSRSLSSVEDAVSPKKL